MRIPHEILTLKRSIEYKTVKQNYEIEDNTLQVEFNGSFTNNQTIQMSFQVAEIDNEVYFESLSESWTMADTREFWIDFMARIYQ